MQPLEFMNPALFGLLAILATGVLIWLGLQLLNRLYPEGADETDHHYRFKRQTAKLLYVAFAVILLLVIVPIPDSTRGQLIGLLGVVITAMIALGSTSFVSNAMAGIMLRSVNNFRPGDFIQVGEHFGRVSERGLFHTEIQTESRDLTTLPNLFLVQQPVTVTRSSGTIVSARVSLGYDVPHDKARKKLLEASQEAELDDGFVRISELLDHAVLYQVYGLLSDTKKLLQARSRLREAILTVLHGADIEIASPSHMIQRRLDDGLHAMPPHLVEVVDLKQDDNEEKLIFDKAEAAEKTETLRSHRETFKQQLETLKKNGDAPDDQIEKLEQKITRIDETLKKRAEETKGSEK